MVLPSSGAISVNDIATEYEIGTGTPIGFDRIKTISTNWSGTSIGLDQFYSLDRDDLVGKSTPNKSVAGLGSFTTFSTIYTMSFRVAVGLSTTTDGNIVNTGNVNTEGVAIYTWNGKLYARAGDGNNSNSGDGEVSFTIPVSWTTDQIRIVVVTFCLNKSANNDDLGTNLLFVDGILRDQSTMTRFEKITSSLDGGKTGVVNAAGFGVKTRMSNNDLSYEAPSAIISTQVWYDRIGYVPAYNTSSSSTGNYFIYENSNVYIVFTNRSTETLGLYDIGPNALPDVRYLMVAGGGGGGEQGESGGGGGGGILFDDTGVALAAGTYTVDVGNGGRSNNPGDNGDDTTFHTYTALGGGGGGRAKSATNNDPGQNGGTGGGGAALDGNTTVGGTGSQGGDGGDGSYYSGNDYGGGGGGGGADGQDGMNGETLGKPVRPWGSGGDGTQYSWGHLGETATYYGGGGAGQGSDATERSLGGGGWDGPGPNKNGEDIYGGGGYANSRGGDGHATFRIPWTLPTS